MTISNWIAKNLTQHQQISFTVLNPDLATGYSGETIKIEEEDYLYRGYKVWTYLAELHHCRVLTPTKLDNHNVELTFVKLNQTDSFHHSNQTKEEKYGVESTFFRINKNEEPTFLLAYKRALESVKITTRETIINLGINKADEFELIESLVSQEQFEMMNLIGIDHSRSALKVAQERFPTKTFYASDINHINQLLLPQADLIISIGTLQSPSINYKPFLMSLVQNHLTDNGAFILGFPNSRWVDGELIYGAKAPNYPYSEMSLLYNDVIFAKKYLQQKRFRVTITGREYIFLTATKINR